MEQQSIEIKYLLKIMKSKRRTRTWASIQQWLEQSVAAWRAAGHAQHRQPWLQAHKSKTIAAAAAAVIQEFHTHVAQRQEDECSKLPLCGRLSQEYDS
jgi:hypothetical protein